MSRLKRPSPALVISIMALVAAIVVPAYAALTKGEKKTVKRLANAQITKRAPGLSVASAANANTANSVRPIEVSEASGHNTSLDFFDQADLSLARACDASGHASLFVAVQGSNNGTFHSTTINENGTAAVVSHRDIDSSFEHGYTTDSSFPNRHLDLTLHYRADDGTTITGELQLAEQTGAAQCLVSGMLFVG